MGVVGVTAAEDLIQFYQRSETFSSTLQGRELLQDLLEEHAGEVVATGGAGAPSYFGCRKLDGETEWCHWIKYANADRVCIRTTNRYVSGFSVSPASTRLVDATLAPETFQLYLAGVDVDGEPIGGDQTDFSDFTGGASA